MTQAGKRLGRYRLDELLGQGGMAEVWRATDERLGRTVAVKVILAGHARDRHFRERFQKEAQLVASLDHPNILPVYDYGDEDGMPYLVMPFLEGGTLRDRMVGAPVPFPQAVSWIRQLGDALDAAHAAGILHRDVKPANVLIRKDDRLALADFGIAKMLETSTGLTATGMVVGTPIYMAPEQAQGKPATPASDRYALAVLAYELLSGKPPFDGESALSLMHQHVTSPAPLLSSAVYGLPAGLDPVFETALAKEPERRPPTCHAFAEQLLAFVPTGTRVDLERPTAPWFAPGQTAATAFEPTPMRAAEKAASRRPELTSEPTISTSPRPSRRTVVGVAAAAAGALALAGAWLLLPRSRPVEPEPAPAARPTAAAAGAEPTPARVTVVEVPVPTAPPAAAISKEAEARLNALSSAVTAAVSRGSLAPPAEGNALDALARLRKEFPGSPAVAMGEQLVAASLDARSAELLRRGDADAARADLLRLQALRPSDAAVAARLAEAERIAASRPGVVAPPPGAPEPPPPPGAEVLSEADLAAVSARLDPAARGGRRPTREDFEAVARAARAAVEKAPEKAGARALELYALGGIAYLDRKDDDALRQLLAAQSVAGKVGAWDLRLVRAVAGRLQGGGGIGGWELALAYGDARREAEALIAKDLAKDATDPRALLGRAALRRMERRSAEAIADATAVFESHPPGFLGATAAELIADEKAALKAWEEAARWYGNAALPQGPVSARAGWEGGRILEERLGRPEDARELYAASCRAGNRKACQKSGDPGPRPRPFARRRTP